MLNAGQMCFSLHPPFPMLRYQAVHFCVKCKKNFLKPLEALFATIQAPASQWKCCRCSSTHLKFYTKPLSQTASILHNCAASKKSHLSPVRSISTMSQWFVNDAANNAIPWQHAATISRPIWVVFYLLLVCPHVHQLMLLWVATLFLCTSAPFSSSSQVTSIFSWKSVRRRTFSVVKFLGTVSRHVAHFPAFVTFDLRVGTISGNVPLVVTPAINHLRLNRTKDNNNNSNNNNNNNNNNNKICRNNRSIHLFCSVS